MDDNPAETLEQQMKAAIVAFLLDDGTRPRRRDTLDLLEDPAEVDRLLGIAAGALRRDGNYCD